MKKISLSIFAVLILAACQNLNMQKIGSNNISSPSSATASSAIKEDGFKEYRNQKISFLYPTTWSMSDIFTGSGYVAFISPLTEKCLMQGKCSIEGPYNDLSVSYSKDINDFLINSDWLGKKKTYSDLDDFIASDRTYSDFHSSKEIQIAHQKGYEVTVAPVDDYGILIEHNGIYFISFPTLHLKSSDTLSAKEKILSSLKFLE